MISKAKALDYSKNYVALPKNYGTPAYFERGDVAAINDTVRENLDTLDRHTGFIRKIRDRKVILKPNLVIAYHRIGFRDEDYPQTTDPRVIDAVVHYLKQYTENIVIAESAGRGAPTRTVFKIMGVDRIARFHGTALIALEEMPCKRYILPKAKVMKEIIVPELFSELAAGSAFYISLAKMKTNLYTGVTLGLKNAMGIIPYNLRQRNHNHALDRKLVDMLYLLRPGLVIIDGIVGGEGNCPAPVFPVDSRLIISGTDSVETDRAAARLMGFAPGEIHYINIATQSGSADPDVRIIGDTEIIPFRKAEPSLLSENFTKEFSNIRVLIGREPAKGTRHLSAGEIVDEEKVKQMEMACRGGCLATLRFAFDMIKYEGFDVSFSLTVILGSGARTAGKSTWFDRHGKPYTKEDIAALPEAKLAVGSCTAELSGVVNRYLEGCMPFPNAPHAAIHRLMGRRCKITTLKNRYLPEFFIGTLRMRAARRRQIKRGRYFDCEFQTEDRVVETRSLSQEEKKADVIPWDFPPMMPEIKKRLLRAERKETIDTFR
ncbi:DUF362 domain-containing protein [Acidobacteriota bacterium]